jgi:hypothetical protein
MNYTISLSDAQQKAMEYVASDVNEWIQNAVANRIRKSTEEITNIYTQTKITNNEAITVVGSDAIITAAFNENIVKTAAQRAADIEAEEAAQQAALGG